MDEAFAAVRNGRIDARVMMPARSLVRYPADTRVDGALLWLGVPFGVVDADGDLYRTTVKRIRQELYRPGGGVRRSPRCCGPTRCTSCSPTKSTTDDVIIAA